MPLKSSCPCAQGDVFTVFIAVRFVIAKKEKSTYTSVNKKIDVNTPVCTRLLEYCVVLNMRDLWPPALTWNISESWYWAHIADCGRAQRLWHLYEVLKHSKPQCILLRHTYIHSWQTYKDLYRNDKTVNSEWWLPGRRAPGLGRGDFLGGSDRKASVYNAGDPGSIPGSGRSLGEGNATHSSTLACEILWTEEPDGLQRIGHNSATEQQHKMLP